MLLNYSNLAKPQALLAAVDAVDTELSVVTTEGYPDAPFIISIDRGFYDDSIGDSIADPDTQEVCLVTSKTATTFTVIRGYDGTEATSHEAGAWVEHASAAKVHREGIIFPTSEATRDTLAGDEIWDGRTIFNEDTSGLEVAVDSQWQPMIPVGLIIPFAGGTAPQGWFMCQGQAVSRSSYAELFAAIGTTYGSGDGSTTFNLPNLRQRIPIGVAASGTADALGETGGQIDHTHTQPTHSHSGPSHDHAIPNTNSGGGHNHTWTTTGSNGSHSHSGSSTGSATVGSTGADEFTSGLVSQSDIAHQHSSHSHSGGTGGGGWSTSIGFTQPLEQPHTHSVGGEEHSHSVASASLSSHSPSRASEHDHSIGTSSTASSHTHNLPNVNSVGGHSHSVGDTGSGGTGDTSSDGDEAFGSANPPFLTLNYIIRV